MSRPVLVAISCVSGGPPLKSWLAADSEGVVQIRLGGEKDHFVHTLTIRGYVPGGKPVWVKQAHKQLDEYYRGLRRRFRLSIQLPKSTTFSTRVIELAQAIPYGTTISYGELAQKAGNRRAARAVGRIMASNQLPIVIPCHRVVAASGLGGFSTGLSIKRALLAIEGSCIDS